MELTQLRAFCAVAQDGSVTAAAARLCRVPSSLTARIQQLERRLGVQLFIRHNNRLRLSSAGRSFLEHALRIVNLVDEAHLSIASDAPSGTLRLGALDVVLASHLPPVIAAYRIQYPSVVLDVSCCPSDTLERAVVCGDMDAALTDGPVSDHLLASQLLYTERLLLLTRLQHPPVRSALDLEDRQTYAFRASCSYRVRMEAWFSQSGIRATRIMEMESYHAMVACVAAGSGVAWIPESMLKSLPGETSVAAHDLGSAGFSEIHLIWRRGEPDANVRSLTRLLQSQPL